MATLAEKKQIETLQTISSMIDSLSAYIETLNISVDNSDVVTALANLTPHNTDVVQAIQNFSYAALMTKLADLLAAINAKSPILKASVARLSEILTANIPANTPVRLFTANANRIGFTVYNNSTNSLYGGPNNSPAGGKLLFQLGTNAGTAASLPTFQCFGPTVWTGEIWVVRNAGTGGVVGYELEP